jgi:predicted transposase/invertase (TIGR01784 family)
MINPHDRLFKEVYGDPRHASGTLQAALPTTIAQAINWQSLERRPGSFVEPELIERHTDLLFSAAWHTGGEALVYLLFEHQSTPDPDMAYRLLRYMMRIWDRWRAEHPGTRSIPMVLPIVLYHGDLAWAVNRSFAPMYAVPEGARPTIDPYLVQFSYLVDDLSQVPDEELRQRSVTALVKLATLSFKHARTHKDLVGLFRGSVDVLFDVMHAVNGREAMRSVMRYNLMVNEHLEPEELTAFFQQTFGEEAKETIMTAGERLVQEGIERGTEQGLEQGLHRGMADMLLDLIRERFGGQVDAKVEQRLTLASLDQLKAWSRRVLSAPTLDAMFAD